MRRVFTFLTAIVLVLGSLAVGVFTADLPFWQRAFQLPLPPDGAYLPSAAIGNAVAAPLPQGAARLDAAAVEDIVMRARAAGSRALLVMQRGELVVERYFGADDARTLMPADLIARPIAAMAAGCAIADGRIASLDTPVGALLHEWDDEARGRITLRQLLEDSSGLERGGETAQLYTRSPWRDPGNLPAFATSKSVRLMLGNDFEATALGFSAAHEAGAFYGISPANPQLVAVMVERATGRAYEHFVDERLWRPIGAGPAELQLDRRSGMPAAHCCWRAAARDILRIAYLLAADGRVGERQVLPAGWVREMARPSHVRAESGLQIARATVSGVEVLSAVDDRGSALWAVPERGLAFVDIAGPGGAPPPPDLPALLLAALHAH